MTSEEYAREIVKLDALRLLESPVFALAKDYLALRERLSLVEAEAMAARKLLDIEGMPYCADEGGFFRIGPSPKKYAAARAAAGESK